MADAQIIVLPRQRRPQPDTTQDAAPPQPTGPAVEPPRQASGGVPFITLVCAMSTGLGIGCFVVSFGEWLTSGREPTYWLLGAGIMWFIATSSLIIALCTRDD
jgi:hypothetical protein